MRKFMLCACVIATLALVACAYHGKQPKDDTYYKRTQSVEWPTN